MRREREELRDPLTFERGTTEERKSFVKSRHNNFKRLRAFRRATNRPGADYSPRGRPFHRGQQNKEVYYDTM